MAHEKMTPKEISKLADDVRTIERFQNESLNNGFNSSYISADVVPRHGAKILDWPLIVFCISLVILFCLIVPRFVTDLSPKVEGLMLVLSLLTSTITVLVAHLKFKEKVATIIICIGLATVVSIGFGVLTPKEAISEAKELVK